MFYIDLQIPFTDLFLIQMKWVIYDESDDTTEERLLGTRDDKFEANSLKDDGSETYTAYLKMLNVNHAEDSDKVISFNFEVLDLVLHKICK